MTRLVLTAAAVLVAAGSAPAAERPPLKKQPAYAAEKPLYAVLAFGPNAEHRMWLVLDLPYDPLREKPGDRDCAYLDRNGNGDLTDPGERVAVQVRTVKVRDHWFFGMPEPPVHDRHIPVFDLGDVPGPDGKPRYSKLKLEVNWYVPGQRYREMELKVTVPGRGEQWAGGPLLRFAEKPEDAPVIHFDGPLSMRLNMSRYLFCPVDYTGKEAAPPRWEQQPLHRGKECEIAANVGTTGVGAGTFVPLTANVPPADRHPVAEITFPHRDAAKPPIVVRVELNKRCCGTRFYAPFPVPADAAVGKATVVLTYPTWIEGAVRRGTGEVTVEDAPKKD
jgi:hypothetical protein